MHMLFTRHWPVQNINLSRMSTPRSSRKRVQRYMTADINPELSYYDLYVVVKRISDVDVGTTSVCACPRFMWRRHGVSARSMRTTVTSHLARHRTQTGVPKSHIRHSYVGSLGLMHGKFRVTIAFSHSNIKTKRTFLCQ